jgi:hypothetical protein
MKLRNLKKETKNLTKSDQVVSEAKKEHKKKWNHITCSITLSIRKLRNQAGILD